MLQITNLQHDTDTDRAKQKSWNTNYIYIYVCVCVYIQYVYCMQVLLAKWTQVSKIKVLTVHNGPIQSVMLGFILHNWIIITDSSCCRSDCYYVLHVQGSGTGCVRVHGSAKNAAKNTVWILSYSIYRSGLMYRNTVC